MGAAPRARLAVPLASASHPSWFDGSGDVEFDSSDASGADRGVPSCVKYSGGVGVGDGVGTSVGVGFGVGVGAGAGVGRCVDSCMSASTSASLGSAFALLSTPVNGAGDTVVTVAVTAVTVTPDATPA